MIKTQEDFEKEVQEMEERLVKVPNSAKAFGEIFDKECNPISFAEYLVRFEDIAYKRINLTPTKEGALISTVWLGLALGYGPEGPLIFETMTFNKEGKEVHTLRAATKEQAERHHNNIVIAFGGKDETIKLPTPIHSSRLAHRLRWTRILEENS